MNKSENIDALAAALAKAQADIKSAIKDSTNPHFRSNYADFTAIVDACRPALAKHGLSFVQPASSADGSTATVTMVLMHSSGQWISDTLTLRPVKADPQGVGSAITYARRYSLASMLGVPTEDDDGNAASGPTDPPPAQRAVPAKPPVAKPADPLTVEVAAWSGTSGADLVSAMRAVATASGNPIAPGTKATDDQRGAMLAWVRGRVAEGKDFAAAVAPAPKGATK